MTERTIHAIIFDLWGTLIYDVPERWEPRRQARIENMARILREAGEPFSPEEVTKALAAADLKIEAIHQAEQDITVSERLRLFLEALRPELAHSLPEDVRDRLLKVQVGVIGNYLPLVMPGAREALDQARAFGLRIGLVSNTGPTPGVVLRQVLYGLGMADFFDAWIWSDEVGLWKPAPRIYQLATEALGVPATRSLFLGDTPETDILGALRAGMWAIQVGERTADGIEPHARVSSPADLWAAITTLGLTPQPPDPPMPARTKRQSAEPA